MRAQARALNVTLKTVAPLSEKEAFKNGSELLGEFAMFFVAAGVVYFEYTRNQIKEKAKEAQMKRREAENRAMIFALESRISSLATELELLRDVAPRRYSGTTATRDTASTSLPGTLPSVDIVAAEAAGIRPSFVHALELTRVAPRSAA